MSSDTRDTASWTLFFFRLSSDWRSNNYFLKGNFGGEREKRTDQKKNKRLYFTSKSKPSRIRDTGQSDGIIHQCKTNQPLQTELIINSYALKSTCCLHTVMSVLIRTLWSCFFLVLVSVIRLFFSRWCNNHQNLLRSHTYWKYVEQSLYTLKKKNKFTCVIYSLIHQSTMNFCPR